ncbi:MAG: HAD-IIIA family hydrolase [Cystobacterineae bacterium]|nr:HAD-IIIA family hydrolase [Cystobacterineae bacterium]
MSIPYVRKALILAGGRGTRLGALTEELPKPLLPVGGVPFLEYVIWNLVRWGISDIILSTGYRAEAIRERLGDGAAMGARIHYAEENSPLGTGGGVRFAAAHVAEPFFVLNGDTLLDCNFQPLAQLVYQHQAKAGIVLREVEEAGRFGAVDFSNNHIHGFHEKGAAGSGLINGGVYVLTPAAVHALPLGASSLERELFPLLAKEGTLVGTVCNGFFLDMGLPSTYGEAQRLLPAWKKKAVKKTVIVDRDGTLIVEKNYLHNPDEVEILPGVVEGLLLLRQHGYSLMVATNQAGVGRGYYSVEEMHAVNQRLQTLLREKGVELDAMYYCLHAPDEACPCRKPAPGMLEQAACERGLSFESSFVIGDKECDILLGKYAGMQTVLLRTGYGAQTEQQGSQATYVADTLYEAARWIVSAADSCRG